MDVFEEVSVVPLAEDGGGTTIEARLLSLCKDLSLDESDMLEQTMNLFGELKSRLLWFYSLTKASASGIGVSDEVERYWFAHTIFIVRRLSGSDRPAQKGLKICQILKAAKLNVTDFFKKLNIFLIEAEATPILSNLYGEDWAKRIKAMEERNNFVYMFQLSRKYERAYNDLFLESKLCNEMDLKAVNVSCSKPNYYRFGWLLLLALCERVFKGLVSFTHCLVSVLAILLIHAPARLRNFYLKDSEHIVMKGEKVDLVASLCNMYDTSEEELRRTLKQSNIYLADILKKEARAASDQLSENLKNIVTDGLVYFEDLMDEAFFSSSVIILEKDYETMIHDDFKFDERIFIDENESFLGSGSFYDEPGVVNGNEAKRKEEALPSPEETAFSHLSPNRHSNAITVGMSKLSATPISTTMTTAKWLRTVIAPLSPRPSPILEKFLSSCDRDVVSNVTRRAHIILEAIFPSGVAGQKASLMDNIWAEQRRMEAMKIYFKVLQAICTAESQILQVNNLTSLLTNERFHRCMIACSAELVLATHKTVTLLFPSVLEKTGITAFDLSKVIENFIRHEESLPRELRRHLNSLEERLLESMVWEKGSSMFNSLMVARPAIAAEIGRLGLLAEPLPSLDAIVMHTATSSVVATMQSNVKQEINGQKVDVRSPKRICTEKRSALVDRNSFTSPVKDRLVAPNNVKSKLPSHVLQSAFASPTRPNPNGAGETCAETAVNMFFSKILKLAAVRINGMVERLQLSLQVKEHVYCLFQKILVQHTTLFFNRHIDQIILCCFYGFAKISHLKLTFKEIIFNYRKQPHCKFQVFRSVYIDWTAHSRDGKIGTDNVDIITFYNQVFIPVVKPLLVELASPQSSSNGADGTNNFDVGSPPTFPVIPYMSPKKVSAVHNVYVSPLRSSKMDALISHSSKSFYACVGESTRAYQSPSKDLTVINNRLNGKRKLRGALDFDIVSDSVVYIQNGD